MIGSLTLDQLRVLVAIADRGGFSAAGRSLLRAQSAISQAVATLEAAQGVALFDRRAHRPVLTEAGRVLVGQARAVLAEAARFEAMAAGTRAGIEPELAVAIDPLVPTAPLIASLRALGERFPDLEVSFSTEGLGGAARQLRRGRASLAFCVLLPRVPEEFAAFRLAASRLVPVAAAGHALGEAMQAGRGLTAAEAGREVQLVLSDPEAAEEPGHGIVGRRVWRFADLGRRLDFLLAGFGWCRMPEHIVAPLLAEGRLVRLEIADDPAAPEGELAIHAAYRRDRPPGPAGRWLLEELRGRLA